MLGRGLLSGGMLLAVFGCSENTATSTMTYPEAGSADANLMLSHCGYCHVAPQPNQRSAEDWIGIVNRMQLRMKTKGGIPMTQEDLERVLAYLQRNAVKP